MAAIVSAMSGGCILAVDDGCSVETVGDLKRAIQDCRGMRRYQQRLVLGERELAFESTIREQAKELSVRAMLAPDRATDVFVTAVPPEVFDVRQDGAVLTFSPDEDDGNDHLVTVAFNPRAPPLPSSEVLGQLTVQSFGGAVLAVCPLRGFHGPVLDVEFDGSRRVWEPLDRARPPGPSQFCCRAAGHLLITTKALRCPQR